MTYKFWFELAILTKNKIKFWGQNCNFVKVWYRNYKFQLRHILKNLLRTRLNGSSDLSI